MRQTGRMFVMFVDCCHGGPSLSIGFQEIRQKFRGKRLTGSDFFMDAMKSQGHRTRTGDPGLAYPESIQESRVD